MWDLPDGARGHKTSVILLSHLFPTRSQHVCSCVFLRNLLFYLAVFTGAWSTGGRGGGGGRSAWVCLAALSIACWRHFCRHAQTGDTLVMDGVFSNFLSAINIHTLLLVTQNWFAADYSYHHWPILRTRELFCWKAFHHCNTDDNTDLRWLFKIMHITR